MRNMQTGLCGIALAVVLASVAPAPAVTVLPACDSEDRPGPGPTCITTGDRGWHEGTRWRLKDTEAPEISARRAECHDEQISGIKTRDRLRILMSGGYTIFQSGLTDLRGWPLVSIKLTDGRDVSSELMSEGIVQALPNTTNRWCNR